MTKFNDAHTDGIRYQGGFPACTTEGPHEKYPGIHNCKRFGIHTDRGPRCLCCLAKDLGWTKAYQAGLIARKNAFITEERTQYLFLLEHGVAVETVETLWEIKDQ